MLTGATVQCKGDRGNRLTPFSPQLQNKPLQTEALATAAVRAAYKLNAALIIVFTVTGRTARLIAKYRPQQPVLTVGGGTRPQLLYLHVDGPALGSAAVGAGTRLSLWRVLQRLWALGGCRHN